MALRYVFAFVSFSEKNETINAASANVMSVFITLPVPNDPASSNKFLNLYIRIK